MFDLKELEAFVSVMKSQSLTESARMLDLPKSTMSRRIRQLESELGQALLRRESNKLIPTEAGKLFLHYAQEILDLAGNGRSALDELKQDVSGKLVVNCHDALLRPWFGPLMLEFMNTFPGLEVSLKTQIAPPGLEQKDGLCLWLGKEPEAGMNCEHIGTLHQSVYASPAYLQQHEPPAHPSDLACHRWIGLGSEEQDGVEFWHLNEGRSKPSLANSRLKVDRLFMKVDAIVNGGGLGLLPDWSVSRRESHHPGGLVKCLPEWQGPSQGIYLLYPHGSLTRRAQVFLTYIRQSLPQEWLG